MRLIDADDFRVRTIKWANCVPTVEGAGRYAIMTLDEALKRAPTIEAEPVVHAHWEKALEDVTGATYKCSRCGRAVYGAYARGSVSKMYPYCHCGAKMDEEE